MRAFISSRALVVAVFLFCLLESTAKGQGLGKSYTIGGIFPLTGISTPIGIKQRDTLLKLVQIINERGGINRRPLKLIDLDSGGVPTNVPRVVQTLINEGVVAIIGSYLIPTSVAAIPEVAATETPFISTSIGPNIGTEFIRDMETIRPLSKWVFQSAPRFTLWIDKVLWDIRSQGFSRISLYGPEEDETIRRYIIRKVKELDLKIEKVITYPLKALQENKALRYLEIGHSTQATIGYEYDMQLPRDIWSKVLKKASKNFYIVFPLISDFNRSPSFPKYKQLRLVAPKFLFEKFVDSDQQKAQVTAFTEYMKRFDYRWNKYDAPVYDAVMLIKNALETVKTSNIKDIRKEIRKHIETRTKFIGVSGLFSFSRKDHNGLSTQSLTVLPVNEKNGCPDDLHKCPSCKCAGSAGDC